jgi:hypothetical protein
MADQRVVLYGASDDLVEVDGNLKGCDEYPTDDAHFVLTGGAAGAVRIRVWFTKRGLWAVAAAPVDEGVPMLSLHIYGAENGYSAMAVVEGVEMVVHEVPAGAET